MIPMLFALIPVSGCGDEVASPSTPPIAEWCDLDRPREDCEAKFIIVNNGNLEEAKALCETSCTRAKGISIGGGDPELLKAIQGFKYVGVLELRASHSTVRDLRAWETINEAGIIRIEDNSGLESLDGLGNLVRVGPPTDSEFELTSGNVIQIGGNPNLNSVSALKNLKTVGTIDINHNGSLQVVEGLNNLSTGTVRIEYNDTLERVSGFDAYETQGALVLQHNNKLITVDGFQNLSEARSVYVYRNRILDECQVQRIVDQLTNIPEILEISENGKTCD